MEFIVLLLGEVGRHFYLIDRYLASETGLVVQLLLFDQLGNLYIFTELFEGEVEVID